MSAYIYDGLRTPFGRHAGALAPVRPDDLLSGVIRTLLTRGPFEPGAVEDVVIGCANQAGEDSRNVARHAALLAGLPLEVGGVTVNRLCGSGLAAVLDAARAVMTGQGELLVAGGVESMSRAPFAMGKAESPYSREAQVFDTTLGARFPNARLVARFGGDTMPETADNIARDLGIGRAATDRFALASQQKYATAQARGFFSGELVPVELPGRRGAVTTVSADEHPRADTTLDKLSTLKPLAPDGVVTAGNASGINDGAAALLVGSLNVGEQAGCRPLARIVSAAIAGVPPRTMGLGPVPAARKALERARLTLADVDVIEVNEAFAVQVLGCLKLLELSEDDSRVNPNGGAIAVGHPLGASGARLALTAARQLQVSGGRYALVSMCIGVGQGIAAVLERV
ncbi:3-oxoadipyl-CoA thiolase [Myxococcus sp. CA051A]|uniref:3-oxoadipyl-CoA thiolase n=1 Tax=unclassified Myxococcus TaxID=2648731 RepID=UPI00157BA5C1|nr:MULTISPECIES: 3-oxoadipyl-CoA thiolase [unclassified Myxococcus]NTX10077.1 3-oxoadipyl-CoA thiolase [Myxococcus sp. CA056]NTX64541.1 3-oxoadipyl-CoA thiolase [Myxococcus sp. CA051A]